MPWAFCSLAAFSIKQLVVAKRGDCVRFRALGYQAFWEKNRQQGEQEYQRYQQRIEPIPEESVVAPPPIRVTSQAPAPDHKTQTPPETSDQVAYRQKGGTHQDATRKSRTAFELSSGKTNALAKSIVNDLRSPDSLRKAFVLREILGEPVSLRDGQSGNSGI